MLLWMFAAVCAYYVKGLCGFANTLVFTSILAYGESNAAITPVDLLVGCPANALMAWRYRHEADWHVWLPMAVLLFVGIIPGVFLLKNIDARIVKLLFGLVVTGLGVEMLLRSQQQGTAKGSRPVMMVIGVLSGILCGLYGVGALLAAYLSRTTTDAKAFKGSLSIVFLLENVFRIILYAVTGVFTWAVIQRALWMLPCMALGLFLGMKSAGHFSEQTAKRIVIIMLIISGVALILTNL